ncbi:DUF4260 domain-containing protein [Variovorax dokdonensis]|uniref:DUF4260 domain-containing protein n=1 Tax=Variovorax dokdonensis TaxID=344883 RepID=A0ABT7NG81_9BURK|nr:DUF4260 domain-containing protein [Variovorax dokdonensis]MDM0046885.1 DUF4260 domain-containing protein [Variovorax dokdonensis]
MAEAADWRAGTGATRTGGPRLITTRRPAEPAALGATSAGVRMLLRAEGLALLIGALALYAQFGAGWGVFAAAFLLPDLALLAYLAGPRIGAMAYNATHSTLGPLACAAAGALTASPVLVAAGLVWAAHVGLDRALGFGLKYWRGFASTHLGQIGRPDPW